MLQRISYALLITGSLFGAGCFLDADDDEGPECVTSCDEAKGSCEVDCDDADNECRVECQGEREECVRSCG
jgi:hypothetical protein